MRAAFVLLALVATVFANSPPRQTLPVVGQIGNGWGHGKLFRYNVDARTLTALDVNGGGRSAGSKWAGVHLKGQLDLNSLGNNLLQGQVKKAAYGEVHQDLPNGWDGVMPQGIQYQSYPALEIPFKVRMDKGLFVELMVPKGMGVAEQNLLKGLLSALQYDTSSHGLVDSRNTFLNNDKTNGVYRKMEMDVTGMCNTLYSVAPLTSKTIMDNPHLAPMAAISKSNQQFLEITKTKNYENCEKRMAYNYGVPEGADWENNEHESDFMTRSMLQRLIVNRNDRVIYAATSTNRVNAKPLFYAKNGMVISSVNMTLSYMGNSQPLSATPQLQSVGGLLYGLTNKNSHYDGQSSNKQQTLLGQNGKGQLRDDVKILAHAAASQEGKNSRVRRSAHLSVEENKSGEGHRSVFPKVNIIPGGLKIKNDLNVSGEKKGLFNLGHFGASREAGVSINTPGIDIKPGVLLPGIKINPLELNRSVSWNFTHNHDGKEKGLPNLFGNNAFQWNSTHTHTQGSSETRHAQLGGSSEHSVEKHVDWKIGSGENKPHTKEWTKGGSFEFTHNHGQNTQHGKSHSGSGSSEHISSELRQPEHQHPGQGRPGQGRPGQGRPGQGQPGQGQPGQGGPGQQHPGQQQPGQQYPGQQQPGQGRPGHGRPDQGRPGQGQLRPVEDHSSWSHTKPGYKGSNKWNDQYDSSSSSQSEDQWDSLPDEKDIVTNGLYAEPEDQSQQHFHVENVRRIAMEMANEFQKPGQMPGVETISKLNLLVGSVSKINLQYLEQTTNQLKDYKNLVSKVAWRLYCDALALSGTGPAFTHLGNLVGNGKIRGEKAAQVITILTNSLRYPTVQQISKLLSLATSNTVKNEEGLNSTVWLVTTRLVNKAYVDKNTAHRYYPEHMYGKFGSKASIILPRVLDVLRKNLQEAVNNKDTRKVQVFIEALGNLGHPAILDVLVPYLQGKNSLSKYLRMHIVNNMNSLVKAYPKEARNILFNLYKNESEHYEVRVAAVFKLLKSRPTITMLLTMAEATHNDPSRNVRSAIQSGIRASSYLRRRGCEQLVKNARTAARLLSTQSYGLMNSKIYLEHHQSSNSDTGYDGYFFQVGSAKGILPKAFAMKLQKKFGAWMKQIKLQGAVSNPQQMLEVIFTEMVSNKNQRDGMVDAITNLLNIQKDSKGPLEANIFYKIYNQERFFAFDQHSLRRFSGILKGKFDELRKGYSYSYTKVLTNEDAVIMFPLAMGVPSYFRYTSPTVINVDGNIKGQLDRPVGFVPRSANVTGDFNFLYGRNDEGAIGFINTVGGKKQHVTAGVIIKKQINIPVRGGVSIDFMKGSLGVEMSPLKNENVDIFHYSVTPYTSISDQSEIMKPILQRKQTHLVKRHTPRTQTNRQYGVETGMVFNTETVSDEYEIPFMQENKKSSDFIMSIFNLGMRNQLSYYKYNFGYDAKKSSTNRMIFNMHFETNRAMRQQPYPAQQHPGQQHPGQQHPGQHPGQQHPGQQHPGQQHPGQQHPGQQHPGQQHPGQQHPGQQQGKWNSLTEVINFVPSDMAPNSPSRRYEILQKVTAGIKSAHGYVFDINLQFLGKSSANYVMTVGYSRSPVDQKVQSYVYYQRKSSTNKQFQFVGVMSAKMPSTPIMDLQQVLKFEAYPSFDMLIKYGQKIQNGAQVRIQGVADRTPKYKQYLNNNPIIKVCNEQMKNGNYMQDACRKAIQLASLLDHSKITVQYQNVGNQAKQNVYGIFSVLRQLGYRYVEQNWVSHKGGKDNTIEIDLGLNLDIETIDIMINLPNAYISFKKVPMDKIFIRPIIMRRPGTSVHKRIMMNIYGFEFAPTCVIDGNQIQTFNNLTYGHRVQNCKYLAMESGLGQGNEHRGRKVAVSTIDVNGRKQIDVVYISLNGDSVDVSLSQNAISVNGQKVTLQKEEVYRLWGIKDNVQILELYQRYNGEYVVDFDEGELKIITTGPTVLVLPRWTFGGNTRGLCGSMNADNRHNLLAPRNCYMRDPRRFAVTWALPDAKCDAQTKQLQQQIKARDVCVQKEWRSPSIDMPGIYPPGRPGFQPGPNDGNRPGQSPRPNLPSGSSEEKRPGFPHPGQSSRPNHPSGSSEEKRPGFPHPGQSSRPNHPSGSSEEKRPGGSNSGNPLRPSVRPGPNGGNRPDGSHPGQTWMPVVIPGIHNSRPNVSQWPNGVEGGEKINVTSLYHPASGGDDDDYRIIPSRDGHSNNFVTKAHGTLAVGCHMVEQVQFVELGVGELCITHQRLPACSRRCSQLNLSPLKAKAHCRPCNDQEFESIVEQIRKGGNPKLDQSKYPVNRELHFAAPRSCIA